MLNYLLIVKDDMIRQEIYAIELLKKILGGMFEALEYLLLRASIQVFVNLFDLILINFSSELIIFLKTVNNRRFRDSPD